METNASHGWKKAAGQWLRRQADGVEPVCLRNTSLKYCAEAKPQSAAILEMGAEVVSSSFRAILTRWRASQSAGVRPVWRLKSSKRRERE